MRTVSIDVALGIKKDTHCSNSCSASISLTRCISTGSGSRSAPPAVGADAREVKPFVAGRPNDAVLPRFCNAASFALASSIIDRLGSDGRGLGLLKEPGESCEEAGLPECELPLVSVKP